jgi:hypothetical protein
MFWRCCEGGRDAEPEFLNFSGAQKSIPMNQFHLAVEFGGPVKQPYSPTLFIAPIDCLKIPALVENI